MSIKDKFENNNIVVMSNIRSFRKDLIDSNNSFQIKPK